jgi:hypothetical protein
LQVAPNTSGIQCKLNLRSKLNHKDFLPAAFALAHLRLAAAAIFVLAAALIFRLPLAGFTNDFAFIFAQRIF